MKYFLLLAVLAIATSTKFLEENPIKYSSRGIDVSSYQAKIDWKKVKGTDIKFAILRTTVKNGQMDTSFESHYSGAKGIGLDVAGYHYSYSMNTDQAVSAAKNLIKKLNGKKMPIYLDLEYTEQGKLGKNKVTEIAKAFVNTMKEAGYEANIYSNKNWYKNYYYPEDLKKLGCKFWIAAYGPNDGQIHEKYQPNVGEIIWQYSSKGKVSGVPGDCDVNVKY